LQELEFDSTLGKIPEEEYPVQRELLFQHGADVLRRLDVLQGQNLSEEAEKHFEAAVAARRTSGVSPQAGGGNGTHPDDPVKLITPAAKPAGKAAGLP
jgi:hypothetical protein